MDPQAKAQFILLATDNGKMLSSACQCLLEQFTTDAGTIPPSEELHTHLDQLYADVCANRYEWAMRQLGRTAEDVLTEWEFEVMEGVEKRRGFIFDDNDVVF